MSSQGKCTDMELRNRSFQNHIPGGYIYAYENSADVLATFEYAETTKKCMDFHKKTQREDGTLPPSDFEMETFTASPFFINKPKGVFCFSQKYTDGVCARLPSQTPLYPARDNPVRAEQNAYYTQSLLEKTNPFRPEFSIPVFAVELLELPSMFKLAASSFAGLIGGGYLNYRFGWLQFVSDIKTLAGITKALESRMKEFESLRLHGGLRRTVLLDRGAHSASATHVPLSTVYGVSVYGDCQNSQAIEVWGSVRWYPTEDYSRSLSKLSNFNLAVNAIFDLDVLDPETLWQASPFTWLVDYFEDIGGFLTANANRALVEPRDICIMRRHRSRDQYTVTELDERATVNGNGSHYRETKARDVWTRGNFPALPVSILTESHMKAVLALFLSFAGKMR